MSAQTPPPASDLAPIDVTLLDGAVRYLNRAILASGLHLATTISEYTLTTFFADDFAAFSSKDPHKGASFRALCAREDLQIGEQTLRNLVRVGHQARHLPADLAESLSLSHHRALLAVDNPQHKQHLARTALQHDWSVEQLQQTIAAEKPLPPHPLGRPKMAPVMKWLGGMQRAAGKAADAPTFAADFAKLPAEDRAKVAADLQALKATLEALLAAAGPA